MYEMLSKPYGTTILKDLLSSFPLTVRDAAVKAERTRLPLRGAVRGIVDFSRGNPASGGRRGIWGDFRPTGQSEIKARNDWKNSQSYFSFLILFF